MSELSLIPGAILHVYGSDDRVVLLVCSLTSAPAFTLHPSVALSKVGGAAHFWHSLTIERSLVGMTLTRTCVERSSALPSALFSPADARRPTRQSIPRRDMVGIGRQVAKLATCNPTALPPTPPRRPGIVNVLSNAMQRAPLRSTPPFSPPSPAPTWIRVSSRRRRGGHDRRSQPATQYPGKAAGRAR